MKKEFGDNSQGRFMDREGQDILMGDYISSCYDVFWCDNLCELSFFDILSVSYLTRADLQIQIPRAPSQGDACQRI